MLSKIKKHFSDTGLPHHPKKHHKPFRIHHVGLFFGGIILIIFTVFGVGFVLGRADYSDVFVDNFSEQAVETTFGEVRSSLGFQFNFDSATFFVTGQTASSDGEQFRSDENLASGDKLSEVTAKPRNLAVSGQDSLTEFELFSDENSQGFDEYKNTHFSTSENQALIDYFAPEDYENFSYEIVNQNTEDVGGIEMSRILYKKNPNFGQDSKALFQVMWVGINQKRPVKIQLNNLLSSSEIPIIYNQIFRSIKFGIVTTNNVQPLAFSLFSDREEENSAQEALDINAISPAVVKVYHFICGKLVVQGETYGGDVCDASFGSGFLVSSEGHIATNGHVIVREAPDILVSEFLNNPQLLAQFAASAGLTNEQASQNDVIASLLANIYDLPEDKLRLENRQEAVVVSLGDRPINTSSQDEIRQLIKLSDSDYIKKAEILGVNYQPKDLLIIEQGTEFGFSASDVALLKVNENNTPLITLADSSKMQQNDPISLIGFPGDAENKLTANSRIAPSVTNGTISSIRTAKGSNAKLFQSDADASQGNSGGPAINSEGQAFGILTYRFKDNNIANAAKSYIRDIADFQKLVNANDIVLNTDSETQVQWEEGLALYDESRFSKAIDKFEFVLEKYPAHRLANAYGLQAQQAIADGKEAKEANYSLIGLVYGAIAGIVGVTIGYVLIVHHRRNHLAYKEKHSEKQSRRGTS